MTADRVCRRCGVSLAGTPAQRRYCSTACRNAHYAALERREGPRIATCRECERRWELKPGSRGISPPVCPTCIAARVVARTIEDRTIPSPVRRVRPKRPKPARRPLWRFCARCGASFDPRDRRNYFCSSSCRQADAWFRRPVEQRREKRRRQVARRRNGGGLA